jgi:hypothetical protein
MQIDTDRGWVRTGLAVLVAGVLGGGVLAVAGDSDSPRKVTADGVAGASPAAAAQPLAPPEPAKGDPEVGDKVEMGSDGGSVTVSAVEDNVSAGRLFGAGENQKYVAAEVKGCSGPNEKNITFEPAWFLLRLDDGTVRDSGPGAKKPSLEGGKVPPGKCLSGWVTFTVPTGALPAAVIYDGSSRTTWTVPLPKNAKQTTTTTMRAGAGSPTTADESTTTTTAKAKATTTTTRARSTATTAKPTTTTAKPTTTTAKPTTTTAKSGSSTTTKPSAATSTTGKSGSSSTPTTSGTKTTTTTTPAKATTTTTAGPNVVADPADPAG